MLNTQGFIFRNLSKEGFEGLPTTHTILNLTKTTDEIEKGINLESLVVDCHILLSLTEEGMIGNRVEDAVDFALGDAEHFIRSFRLGTYIISYYRGLSRIYFQAFTAMNPQMIPKIINPT